MTNEHEPSQDDTAANQLTRRTVVKGAAWSVPVIAASAAVPLAAASDVEPEPDCTASNYIASVTTAYNPRPTGTPETASGGVYQIATTQRTVYFKSTVAYNGPEDLQVGSLITVAHGISTGRSYTVYAPTQTAVMTEYLEPAASTSVPNTSGAWRYRVKKPVPAGTTFVFSFRVDCTYPQGTSAQHNGGTYALTYFEPYCDGVELKEASSSVATDRSLTGPGTAQANIWYATIN